MCRMRPLLLAFIATVVTTSTAAWAEVSLPSIFGDHMVLQQESKVAIWGKASPGEEVKVSLGDSKAETTGDDNGRWSVRLETPKATSEGQKLTIQGKNKVVLNDVLIGEVWVASGQSNMEWTVAQSANPQEEAKNANYPGIRMIKVAHNAAKEPQDDIKGQWALCTPETAPHFSAVGYFFARKLHEELQVPVGIISTNWGGTLAEAWTSKATLESDPDFAPILERSQNFQPGNPNQASVLYNGMIHPILPYTIRGAIWYQGESNRSRAEQYAKLFPAMIADWRKLWGQGDFPFYFVQLAPFKYNREHDVPELAELWEAQTKTLDASKHTGMAVTTDIGNLNDIHPANKQDVGLRLALWALAKDYGKDVAYSGPLYDSMEVDGNKVHIKFKHGEGLQVQRGDEPKLLAVAGEDKRFVPAKGKIDGDTLVVWSDEVEKPVAVRYGWSEWAQPEDYNLYNGAGLPASPFRTDEFPLITAGRR